MNFGLTEDQELFKSTLRRFLEEQCPTSRVRATMESTNGHDPRLWSSLAELGVTGLNIPAAYGGSGLELLDLGLAAEELGYAAVPGPFLANAMATVALLEGGDAVQRERWLPRLASGEAIASIAISEADGEWTPSALKSRAEGETLTGDKPLVPYGDVADVIVVAAQDGAGPGLWLVEANAPGLTVAPLKVIDLTRHLHSLSLRGTPAVRIGGAQALQRTIDAGCVLLAADAYGGAKRCLDMALQYALTREQFGQVIGAFQAVKHQLADMVTEIEPCLALWWYAAHAFDRIKDQSERHAALAKAHLSDVFDAIARQATEIHGGIGFTWEFDLHLWFRRSVFDRGFLGDATFHRARAAALSGW